jgi:hypothetical protein
MPAIGYAGFSTCVLPCPLPRPDGLPKFCLIDMIFGEPAAASNAMMRKEIALGIHIGKTRDP